MAYRLFISHSWSYSDQYLRLVELLNRELGFFYNHSVPQSDPVHTNGTDRELYNKIEAQVRGCSCVVILAGVYATYSKWINKEIEIAEKLGKPIIAVEYWGAEHTSTVVKNAATEIVRWNASSIASAIRRNS
ncbi:MAG: TIR domain-containing protein [Bacteroides sp.]|nr:TIR domain-containing protein [Bacteroides sp.]MDE6577261.1 TIR domain-containing protein [Muribaculaceae bacterium]